MGESEFILVLMEKMNGKLFLDQFIRTFGSTLEFLINVPVRLLIFEQFSHQYALIRTSTFIFYEQLMILYTCTWPIFMRNYIFEAIILHQYAYLDQYVYWIWQNFPPVLLFGPVRLLGTLE